MPNYKENYAYGGAPKRKIRYGGRTDKKLPSKSAVSNHSFSSRVMRTSGMWRQTLETLKDSTLTPEERRNAENWKNILRANLDGLREKGKARKEQAGALEGADEVLKNRNLDNVRETFLAKDEKGLGGLIGTGLGAIGGSFLGNPMLGAKIGGALGGAAESVLTKKEPQRMKTRGSGMLIDGGFVNDIPQMLDLGGAVKFQGANHEQGGIDIGDNTEVEGGETMDMIDGDNYVFSKRLKVPGTYKTFAKYHEDLITSGADINTIKELAELQESVSGRRRQT